MRNTLLGLLVVLGLLPLLAACGGAPETVDTEAIVATVSAQVEAERVAVRQPAAEPTVDTAAIAASVLEQLQAEQATVAALATATPEPTATATAEPLVPVNNLNGALAAADLQTALVDVYRAANPAVVFIITELGSGTGFVYDEAGHIVTNNHVIADGNSYEVVFADGQRRAGRLVGNDLDSDLAVLEVDDLPAAVEPLELADGESLEVGQLVVAIGNPFGEEGSMSLGIISGLGRSLPSQRGALGGSSYSLPGVIQTDAPINPGNSGGPLLTLEGKVAGINSAIATFSGTNSGVGFSIPVQAVAQIVPHLIEAGGYDYSYMGAGFREEVSLSDQSTFGLSQTQGAYVLNVTSGGPAAAAGLTAANPTTGRGGDLIIAVDGQPVSDFNDLNSYLVFNTEPGQTVELTVLRGDEEIVLPLTLSSRP